MSKLWVLVSNPDLYHQKSSLVPLPLGVSQTVHENPWVLPENRSGRNFKGGPGFIFLAYAPDDYGNTLKTEDIKPTPHAACLVVPAILTHAPHKSPPLPPQGSHRGGQ